MGRLTIGCIVVMKRFIGYILIATDGLSHRLQNSASVAANGLSRWFHNAEESFAKDQLKRYLPALYRDSAGRNAAISSNNFK